MNKNNPLTDEQIEQLILGYIYNREELAKISNQEYNGCTAEEIKNYINDCIAYLEIAEGIKMAASGKLVAVKEYDGWGFYDPNKEGDPGWNYCLH